MCDEKKNERWEWGGLKEWWCEWSCERKKKKKERKRGVESEREAEKREVYTQFIKLN